MDTLTHQDHSWQSHIVEIIILVVLATIFMLLATWLRREVIPYYALCRSDALFTRYSGRVSTFVVSNALYFGVIAICILGYAYVEYIVDDAIDVKAHLIFSGICAASFGWMVSSNIARNINKISLTFDSIKWLDQTFTDNNLGWLTKKIRVYDLGNIIEFLEQNELQPEEKEKLLMAALNVGNVLERLAYLYLINYLDKNVADNSLKNTFTSFYKFFYPLIRYYQKRDDAGRPGGRTKTYDCLYYLVEKNWNNQMGDDFDTNRVESFLRKHFSHCHSLFDNSHTKPVSSINENLVTKDI